jgi:Sigma-70, region 4
VPAVPLGYHWRGPDRVVEPPSVESLVLVTALRQLPADQRYAIVLHHLLGVPVSDVSEQSGVSMNAVKARLASGRRALSELLGWDPLEEADPRFTALYRETGKLGFPSAASLRRRGQQPRRRRVAVTVAAAVILLVGGALVSQARGPEPLPSPPVPLTSGPTVP